MTDRLGKDDWVSAGLQQLAEGGIETVRVEPLARRIGVTKGSFYWHFKDRPALLQAILQAWADRATARVIDDLEALHGTAADRLWALMTRAMSADNRLDRQMRNWAASDPQTAKALARIDAQRIAYLQSLFLQMGLGETEAKARALLIYLAFLGRNGLADQSSASEILTGSLRDIYALVVPSILPD